jgi:cytidylate kinase
MPAIKPFIITIDGPSAAGKGSVAHLLARHFGFLNLDSGALYRAIAWIVLQHHIVPEPSAENQIVALTRQYQFSLLSPIEAGTSQMGVAVNGRNISVQIREPRISEHTPKISAMAGVRAVVVAIQHNLAHDAPYGVVVEGRDTGSVVFPEAQIKIYLTASLEARAERRHAQYIESGKEVAFEEIYSDLAARDLADTERTTAPLTVPHGAIVIDSTNMTLEAVVKRIGAVVQPKLELRVRDGRV